MGFFDSARTFVGNVAQNVARLGQPRPPAMPVDKTPRFKRLDAFDDLYWGEQYRNKGLQEPWDKQTGGRYVALKDQRPSTQYDLPRLIVDRPTALLFGEGRFPELSLEPQVAGGDVTDANKWLAAIADEGDLSHVMLTAARQGSALGTAVVTWSVVEGEFEFEPHLAKYCKPTFHAQKRRRLIALEKRYKFKKEVQVQDFSGAIRIAEKEFWHREEWTETAHIVYEDEPVMDDNSEPIWTVADRSDHNWGRVPGVWIKNLDDGDASDADGVSLLEGLADVTEDVDRTLSQKSRAVRYNQDPERVYYGLNEDQAKRLHVGGGATTLLPAKPAGAVELIELKGDAQKIAEEHVVAQRGRALETARVVVPDSERLLAASRSGAALRILFAPTLELVGELRQSYGRGLRDLLGQILDVARDGKLQQLGTLATPVPVLPPGKPKLQWGRFFDPTPEDLLTVAQAVSMLSSADIVDKETILRAIASYFGIKDVAHVLEMAKQEADERMQNEMGPLSKTAPSVKQKRPPSDRPPSDKKDSTAKSDPTEGGAA